jgi:hypothetical protein
MNSQSNPQAVICVANEGNEVSLQLWKIYKTLRDEDARSEGLIRVIDESGEDYLFPEEYFVPIDLPNGVRKPFERAVREQRRVTALPRSSASLKRRRIESSAESSKRSARKGA